MKTIYVASVFGYNYIWSANESQINKDIISLLPFTGRSSEQTLNRVYIYLP